MVFSIKDGVVVDNFLKHALRFFKVSIDLEQERLIVIDGEVGWVVITEPSLDVFAVFVQYHLCGHVLAKAHALSELLQGVLHLRKLLLGNVFDIIVLAARGLATAVTFIVGREATGREGSEQQWAYRHNSRRVLT